MRFPQKINPDSVHRALCHHLNQSRAITHLGRVTEGNIRWRVTVNGAPGSESTLELTDREAWVLSVGLAAGERAGRLEEQRRTDVSAVG